MAIKPKTKTHARTRPATPSAKAPQKRVAARPETQTAPSAPGTAQSAVVVETMTLAQIVPDPKNRRHHGPRNVGMIVEALEAVGPARSLVIDENNVALAGNGVASAAAAAGYSKVITVDADGDTIVAVRRRGLTDEQKRLLAMYDNRAGELAEWKPEQLRADQADGLDLKPFFTPGELERLTKQPGHANGDAAPAMGALEFRLVVDCKDESDQVQLLQRLESEGVYMPSVDLVVETPVSRSPRSRQLEAMFDVPPSTIATVRWTGDVPLNEKPWQVGLIVGPSGSGKSSLLAHLFDVPARMQWKGASVLDDFDPKLPIAEITAVCQAVGFNTVPAWLRPFRVLSNGEQFRVELARRLATPGMVVIDEFTSVVDRQVAQIAAHAAQKFIRKQPGRQFVAASCHDDIVPWLQPDWILEPSTMRFTWRSLQRRPPLDCLVARVPYETWRLFAPFHYLTADLHRGARCFGLFVGGRIAAFAGMLHRPHARVDDIMGCSRLVTLPDFQGLGLAMALIDQVAAAYRAIGKRVHTYPAHPSLIRTFDRSPSWSMTQRGGMFSGTNTNKGTRNTKVTGRFGGRPNAVFEYVGQSIDVKDAEKLIHAADNV